MKFEFLEEYETKRFSFINDRDCVVVKISGSEYTACQNPDMYCTKDDNPSTRGLGNTKENPSRVERTGRLGECACSKLFGVEVNFDRIEGGDGGIDFTWNNLTFDIKTALSLKNATKYKKNFLKGLDKRGNPMELHADVYIPSFIVEEDQEKKFATVALVGWMAKDRLLHLHRDTGCIQSPVYKNQWNYELPFKATKPIVPLVEAIRTL